MQNMIEEPAGWVRDKAFADQFVPVIKVALATYLIQEATVEDDQQRCTDLVLRADSARIGCRVREPRPEWWNENRGEITIRLSRPTGAKTELRKIMEGWGDLFFYAQANGTDRDHVDGTLSSWSLCSLPKFRELFVKQPRGEAYVVRKNPDGTIFAVFDIKRKFNKIIVAGYNLHPWGDHDKRSGSVARR